MLLERLRLTNFGHFDKFTLSLPEGTRFAVVYGENGAGKTTLLNALRSVLFGIEERSPYVTRPDADGGAPAGVGGAGNGDGDGDPPSLGAVLRDAAGARLEVTRLKRRKNPLSGWKRDAGAAPQSPGVPLDDGTFAACLGLRDRRLYESVFGFTLHDLERGAKVLEEATVGELLAGGALGGDARRVYDFLTELHASAEDLYKPGAYKRRVNARKSRLDELDAERRKHRLSEASYARLRDGLRAAEARADALRRGVEELTRREARAARRVAAFPHWRDLCRAQAELDATLIGVAPTGGPPAAEDGEGAEGAAPPPSTTGGTETELAVAAGETSGRHTFSLTAADADAITGLASRLTAARAACEAADAEVARRAALLGGGPPDDALLGVAPAVDRLIPQLDAMAELRASLPAARQAQARERASLERRLADLLPGVTWDDVEEEGILVAHATRAAGYLQEYEAAKARVTQAHFKCEEKELARDKEARLLDDAGIETRIPDHLSALLPVLDERKQLCREWQKNREECRLGAQDVALRLSRLDPPLPEGASLVGVRLPPESALVALAEERRGLASRVDQCRVARADAARAVADREGALASLAADLPAPDPRDLAAARDRRTEALAAWEQEGHGPDGRVRFVGAVEAADLAADRLIEAAERVARLAERRAELAGQRAALLAREEEERRADAALGDWAARWASLWEGFAVTPVRGPAPGAPGSPGGETSNGTDGFDAAAVAAMLAWRGNVAGLLEAAAAVARLEAEGEAQEKVLLPFEERLRAAFPDADAAPLFELITRLEERRRRADEEAAVRRSRLERLATLEREVSSCRDELQEAAGARDLIAQAGREFLARAGVPSGAGLEEGAALLDALGEAARKKAAWEARERDLETQGQRVAAFDAAVAVLRRAADRQDSHEAATVGTPRPTREEGGGDLSAVTAGTAGSAGTADLSSGLVVAADTAADNETFVLGLARRVREAQEAATRRQERSDHLASARAQQAEARQRLGTLEDEQQSWMRRAGVASEADLERAAGEARRHAGLVTERDRARALLEAALGYGGPPSNETFHDMALSTLAPAAGKAGVGGEDAADTHLLRAALDGLRDASAESLEGERQALLAELEAQRDALGEAQIEVGKLREDLERRGDEQQAALHAALAEEERAALREDVEEYVVRFFAARVLQGVIESYARDNQPALLRTASSLIQRITDGQYGAVRQSRDEKSLVLVPADGGPARLPERLSTGEREQMFLALRLAFVTHYCASAEPLPVVLDDVLVNFDERRAAATLRALADVSRTTQVLFFTCHRDLRDLAAQAVPDAASCDLSLREMGGSA